MFILVFPLQQHGQIRLSNLISRNSCTYYRRSSVSSMPHFHTSGFISKLHCGLLASFKSVSKYTGFL